MKLYKLTDQNGQTYRQTQWGENVTHAGTGKGYLCSPGYIHAYEHPLLAVLLNPLHANFDDPQLWEAEGEIAKRDGQLKVGCISLTTLRRIELPVITDEQRVRFGILCALAVYDDPPFVVWAENWLNGNDRSRVAAAWAGARVAEYLAKKPTTYEAEMAAKCAAESAMKYAVYQVKYAAAYAAVAAAAVKPLDLISLAVQACQEENHA